MHLWRFWWKSTEVVHLPLSFRKQAIESGDEINPTDGMILVMPNSHQQVGVRLPLRVNEAPFGLLLSILVFRQTIPQSLGVL